MSRSSLLPIGIFTVGYILVAAIAAFAMENWEFAFYIVTLIVIIAFIVRVHLRVNLSNVSLWALSVWGLLHMAGGLIPVPQSWPIGGEQHVLYSLWLIPEILKYDHIVHAYGFGIATWICWQALHAMLPKSVPSIGILILCVFAGMGLGALNEIIEFLATVMMPSTNVGGYVNTSLDLISNMAGSLAAAAVIWKLREREDE